MAEKDYARAWANAKQMEPEINKMLLAMADYVEAYGREKFDAETNRAAERIVRLITELPNNNHALPVVAVVLTHLRQDAEERRPGFGDVVMGVITKLMGIGIAYKRVRELREQGRKDH
jgi:hypothetical protein